MVWMFQTFWFIFALSFTPQQKRIMNTIQAAHQAIKARLATRTTEQLISDAKVARAQSAAAEQRMIFALIMDTLMVRLSEEDFEALYEEMDAEVAE